MDKDAYPNHCNGEVLISLGVLHEKVDALNKKVEKQNGRVSTNEKWIRSAAAVIAFVTVLGGMFGKPLLNAWLGDRWTVRDQRVFEQTIENTYVKKENQNAINKQSL